VSGIDDQWWCWQCHGLGQWEDGYDPYDVECPCCGGDGWHDGEVAPECHPAAERNPPTPEPAR